MLLDPLDRPSGVDGLHSSRPYAYSNSCANPDCDPYASSATYLDSIADPNRERTIRASPKCDADTGRYPDTYAITYIRANCCRYTGINFNTRGPGASAYRRRDQWSD